MNAESKTENESVEQRRDYRDLSVEAVKNRCSRLKTNDLLFEHPWADQWLQFPDDLKVIKIAVGHFKRATRDPLAPPEAYWFDFDEIDRRLSRKAMMVEQLSPEADLMRELLAWIVRVRLESADAETQVFSRAMKIAKAFNLNLGVQHLEQKVKI
jgi:hypothetical protein